MEGDAEKQPTRLAENVMAFKAVLARLLFATHMFMSIWMVTRVTENLYWWILTCGFAAYISDVTLLTSSLSTSRYLGFKRNLLCMVIYLTTVVTAVWKTETHLYHKFKPDPKLLRGQYSLGNTSVCRTMDCVRAIEQLTPCMAIFGRWLLPKGDISRDEFSNLLLVFLGVAADILEFMEVVKLDVVGTRGYLVMVAVSLWGWSLFQFALSVPGTKKKAKYTEQLLRQTFLARVEKHRMHNKNVDRTDAFSYVAEHVETGKKLAESVKSKQMAVFEIAVIFANVVFQDAPFFAFRSYVTYVYHIYAPSHIFFTMKNGLVIVLQLYRLFILCDQIIRYRSKQKKFKKDLKAQKSFKVKKASARQNTNQAVVTPDLSTDGLHAISAPTLMIPDCRKRKAVSFHHEKNPEDDIKNQIQSSEGDVLLPTSSVIVVNVETPEETAVLYKNSENVEGPSSTEVQICLEEPEQVPIQVTESEYLEESYDRKASDDNMAIEEKSMRDAYPHHALCEDPSEILIEPQTSSSSQLDERDNKTSYPSPYPKEHSVEELVTSGNRRITENTGDDEDDSDDNNSLVDMRDLSTPIAGLYFSLLSPETAGYQELSTEDLVENEEDSRYNRQMATYTRKYTQNMIVHADGSVEVGEIDTHVAPLAASDDELENFIQQCSDI